MLVKEFRDDGSSGNIRNAIGGISATSNEAREPARRYFSERLKVGFETLMQSLKSG